MGVGTSEGKRGVLADTQRTKDYVLMRVGRRATLNIDPHI